MACIIRSMKKEDVPLLAQEFILQGWGDRTDTLFSYLREQEEGKRKVFTALSDGVAAGYVTLLAKAENGPFKNKNLPEIADFNVLEKFQKQGIGSLLLDAAEKSAKELADTVTLGVGLHAGYGAAQRLYIKRGYVPDGSGVWFENKIADPYTPVFNGDDLILYLSKAL